MCQCQPQLFSRLIRTEAEWHSVSMFYGFSVCCGGFSVLRKWTNSIWQARSDQWPLTSAVCTQLRLTGPCSCAVCAVLVPAVTPGEKQRSAASGARMEAKVTMMGHVTRVTACHSLPRVLRMSLIMPRHTCLTGELSVSHMLDVSWPGLASILESGGHWATLGQRVRPGLRERVLVLPAWTRDWGSLSTQSWAQDTTLTQ